MSVVLLDATFGVAEHMTGVSPLDDTLRTHAS